MFLIRILGIEAIYNYNGLCNLVINTVPGRCTVHLIEYFVFPFTFSSSSLIIAFKLKGWTGPYYLRSIPTVTLIGSDRRKGSGLRKQVPWKSMHNSRRNADIQAY